MHEKLDEQQVAIARVYARSLLELSKKNHEESTLLEEFESMVEQFERQPKFEQILGDPGVDEEERAEILERVLRSRANDLIVNTLQVMNRKGRAGLFRALVQAYREELELLQGVVEADVTTAAEISDALRKRLTEMLERSTGKKVLLNESVDSSLLGGMIMQLGDQKIDSSVARELRRVDKRFLERAAEERQAREAGEQTRTYIEE